MNRQGYIKVMEALVSLMVIFMIEAGKVPVMSAKTIGENVLKAITGGTGEKNNRK